MMADNIKQFDARRIRLFVFTASSLYFFAVIVIAIFFLPNLSFITGQQLTDTGINILYTSPIAVAFLTCAWAARHSKAYRKLWRLLAIGMSFWLAGMICIQAYILAPGYTGIPSPSLADLFAVAYVPMMFAVILSVARIRRPLDNEKKQFVAYTTMAVLAMFMLNYELVLLPLWYQAADTSFMNRIFIVAYPMLDFIILAMLIFASHRLFEQRLEGWIVFLIAAFAVSLIADIPAYAIGEPRNVITMILLRFGILLIIMAAIDEVTGAFIGKRERNEKSKNNVLQTEFNNANPIVAFLMPLAATIVVPLTWLIHFKYQHIGGTTLLFIVSILIIFIAVFRSYKLAVDNAALFTKTLRDRLTGLYNHRYFQEALCRVTSRAKKSNQSASIALIDIDDFSKVNNSHGHARGDEMLTVIGKTIIASLREDDEACRLSGDEFGIIMPNLSGIEAKVRAEVVRDAVYAKLKSAFGVSDITISIGLSTYPSIANTKEELLLTAEGALYWCKLHGKNRILLYDDKIVKILSPEERAKKAEEAVMVDLVSSLAKAVDARDPYTQQHSVGVSKTATRLAKKMGLDADTVNRIRLAGMLHDVGKIGVPDSILNKPGRLTDEEMYTIKNHPVISAQIIQSTSLKGMVKIVRAHHERWDGKGYPDGLKEEKIPLESRILAVADTYDAMTTDRPYRKALSVEDALAEIDRCAGTQFDPDIAKAFLELSLRQSDRAVLKDRIKQATKAV